MTCAIQLSAQIDPWWVGRTTYTVEFSVPDIYKERVKAYYNHVSNSTVEHDKASTKALLDHLHNTLMDASHPMFALTPLGVIDYSRMATKAEIKAATHDSIVMWVEDPKTGDMLETMYAAPGIGLA